MVHEVDLGRIALHAGLPPQAAEGRGIRRDAGAVDLAASLTMIYEAPAITGGGLRAGGRLVGCIGPVDAHWLVGEAALQLGHDVFGQVGHLDPHDVAHDVFAHSERAQLTP